MLSSAAHVDERVCREWQQMHHRVPNGRNHRTKVCSELTGVDSGRISGKSRLKSKQIKKEKKKRKARKENHQSTGWHVFRFLQKIIAKIFVQG